MGIASTRGYWILPYAMRGFKLKYMSMHNIFWTDACVWWNAWLMHITVFLSKWDMTFMDAKMRCIIYRIYDFPWHLGSWVFCGRGTDMDAQICSEVCFMICNFFIAFIKEQRTFALTRLWRLMRDFFVLYILDAILEDNGILLISSNESKIYFWFFFTIPKVLVHYFPKTN